MEKDKMTKMQCRILGFGACGPGFKNWPELNALLCGETDYTDKTFNVPKPGIIPANERRRAPLPVRMAVEVSAQAMSTSGIAAQEAACVFGSGLGDTDITDYMCRTLAGENPQLSPTKFHNSVHNAAAGYWTISSDCMKSANSVAGYHFTAGLSVLEAMSQCVTQNEMVLITLFDTKAHSAYQSLFDCDENFAAAILLAPLKISDKNSKEGLATIEVQLVHEDNSKSEKECMPPHLSQAFEHIYNVNPAAKILGLLNTVGNKLSNTCLQLSPSTRLAIEVSPP